MKKFYAVKFYADEFWTAVQYDNTVLVENSICNICISMKMDCILGDKPNKALKVGHLIIR